MKYSLNGQVMCTLNTLGLLSIERSRKVQVAMKSDTTVFSQEGEDMFTEKLWKGMLEPIPNGPQALSIDIGFPGFQHVYGIPERINSFKVKNTVEYKTEEGVKNKVREEEPFRLFTCDHFNDKYPNHSQYGAVPIMQVTSDDKKMMMGVYWCNASDTFVDIISIDDSKHTHWMSETGHL